MIRIARMLCCVGFGALVGGCGRALAEGCHVHSLFWLWYS